MPSLTLAALRAPCWSAFLAQWLERVAVNHKVVGSIPTGGVLCTSRIVRNMQYSRLGQESRVGNSVRDTVSEWLRRWTRNPLGSAREGSNPFVVAFSNASFLASFFASITLLLADMCTNFLAHATFLVPGL